MTPNDLRSALEAISLRQSDLARLLHVSEVTVCRWAKGGSAIPTSAALIVHLLRGGHVSLETIRGVGLFERVPPV
jgi:DNA-binding transcriptional regulator YiaG